MYLENMQHFLYVCVMHLPSQRKYKNDNFSPVPSPYLFLNIQDYFNKISISKSAKTNLLVRMI